MKELNSQQKGLITEKLVELFFASQGYIVSIPNYYNSRYDFIVDIEDKLYKIQVKTSHIATSGNGIEIYTYSSGRNNEGNHKKLYTSNEIDFFATSFNNKIYLIPIEKISSTNKTLLFDKPKNNQLLWIEDYEGTKIIDALINNSLKNIIEKKPIKQYDTNNNFIAEYTTTVEAIKTIKPDVSNARSASSHITDVINGKRKTAYGFIWKREE